MKDVPEAERAQLKQLFIDLSPFSRKQKLEGKEDASITESNE